MSNQLQITGGAKVRNLEGVLTGTSGVVSSLGINVPSGIPQLDGSGKILVSQLPNSVMEYKGTWDASTNTPTLVDGTGNAGDVYLCNVAGTVNFGSGPITFYVGDQVLYSGTIWQRASGSSGTVTSVGITSTAAALTISSSPITSSGNIGVNFSGNSGQYVSGDGNLVTFPTTIDQAKRLITEVYNSTGATLSKGTVVYINGGQGNLPTITKAQANTDNTSAQTYGVVQSDITNNNNGFVVVFGSLTDLDTQAYAVGTQLYLSGTTAGAWTSTKPSAPIHLVYVGIVVRSHPTQGVVEIRIQNGYELEELHDVAISAPVNNQGIFYNSSTDLWENKSIATVLGYTPADDALVVKLAGTQTITGSKTFSATTLLNTIYVDGVSYLKSQTTTSYIAGYTTFSAKANGVIEYYFPSSFKSILDFNDSGDYTYTFPSASGNLVLGSGSADQVAYWNSASGLTYDSTFYYSSSNKRLGVNTNTPNATIGSNIGIDSGFGLLVKNADNNYNGLGIGIDSSYGNLISSVKIGTAATRNITVLNQTGYHSLTEAGNFGLNILTPTASPSGVGSLGIDVYGGSNAAGIGFHNAASGVGNTNGAYIYLTTGLGFTLRNLEGGITSSSLGDFSVITNSTENFRVNASDGSLWQSNITNSLLKANASNVIVAAVANTDYQAPITLNTSGSSGAATFSSNVLNIPNYTLSGLGGVPTSRTLTINGTAYDLSADRSWSVGTLTGGGADGRVAFWNGATNVVSDSLFVWDDTNNRLGIGLNNPQRSLEIYTTSPDTHLRLSGAAPSVSMGEAITGSIYQAKFGLATASNQFVTGSVAGDFVINNQTGSTIWAYNSTEKMRLDTNGNLGVGGIANSSYRLHVFGTGTMLGIETTAASNVYLRMLQAGTVVGGMYYNNSDSTLRINNNNGGLRFDTSTVNGALTIASTGAATFSSSVTASTLLSVNGASSPSTTPSGTFRITNTAGGTPTQINMGVMDSSPFAGWIQAQHQTLSGFYYPLLLNPQGGNVGIGTSSPNYAGLVSGISVLTLAPTASERWGALELAGNRTAGGNQVGSISFTNINTSNTEVARIQVVNGASSVSQGNIVFYTNAGSGLVDRMYITSSGNVGIGTNNPSSLLDVKGATPFIRITDSSVTGETGLIMDAGGGTIRGGLTINYGTGEYKSYCGVAGNGYFQTFYTNGSERMRITSGGSVLVNQTTNPYSYQFLINGTSNQALMTQTDTTGNDCIGMWNQATTGNNVFTTFYTGASPGVRGNIVYNRASNVTAFNTTSDYRIKTELSDFNALDIISKLKPKEFRIGDAENKSIGFIAHELQEHFSQAVTGEKDAVNEDGTPIYQSVDYSQLTALLTKAIQEQQEQIEELSNKIVDLQSK